MLRKKKILFIINPISGHGRHDNFPARARRHIDNNIYFPKFVYSQKSRDAIKLSRDNADNFDIIVAVGGDGTVNEVSQGIFGKSTTMGIIPVGSGNGLARHLKIPLIISQAVRILNKANTMLIDRIKINDKSFVNMAGIGFDAHVGQKFSEFGKRGFLPYFYLALMEYSKYRPQKYTFFVDGKKYIREAFAISFANSTQFGNNAHIAPDASVNDGLIDLCIIKEFPHTELPNIGIRLFNKSIDQSKYVEIIKSRQIIIKPDKTLHAHIDGEPIILKDKVEIIIVPKSLQIIHNM